MPSRLAAAMTGALVALAIAVPSYAQGKGGGKKPGKGPTQPPSSSVLSAPTNTSTVNLAVDPALATTPFAWLDDASMIAPGNVWLGVSMVRWQGSGLSQTIVPVVDVALGLTPRVQVGASVPRVAGGFGTTFFSAKIAVLNDDARGMNVAVAPTLEILDGANLEAGGAHSGACPSACSSIADTPGSTAAQVISRPGFGTQERASAGPLAIASGYRCRSATHGRHRRRRRRTYRARRGRGGMKSPAAPHTISRRTSLSSDRLAARLESPPRMAPAPRWGSACP